MPSTKKIKAEGKTPKPLYIGGNYKNRLYGNVLNLAHRVRFWDAKNIKQLAYGEYDTVMFERKILGKEYLPERFEEKLYAAMQKTDYISATLQSAESAQHTAYKEKPYL